LLPPIAAARTDNQSRHVVRFARHSAPLAAHLVLSACVSSCEVDLPPGDQISLASTEDQLPFIYVYLTSGDIQQVSFSTTVSFGREPLTTIPTVREGDFRRRKVRLANVPFGGMR